MNTSSICVVDDDPTICSLLNELFADRGHTVYCVQSGEAALAVLESGSYDMIISDMTMPEMNGFELLSIVETRFPSVKRVLMTGHDIDDHLSLIREHQIGNILVKHADFHCEEVIRYVEMLLSGDMFGLDKLFTGSDISVQTICSGHQAKRFSHEVSSQYVGEERVFLEMAINELIVNAVFHAVLQLSGVSREFWNDEYQIDRSKSIKVAWAKDDEKTGVSIEDPIGRLSKADILRWLDHSVSKPSHLIDIEGEHGHGLLLVRQVIDRFIINIETGKRTECILIQYHDKNRALKSFSSKPVLIREI